MLPTESLADLHLHTLASDGLMSSRALVDYVVARTSLGLIAVTDHDETAGALEARDWVVRQGYRLQVVPGVEVTTRDGHLLALFVEERPPALRGLLETAEWVLAHGGLCIAAHPCTRLTHALGGRVVREAAERGLLAGIEVLNASPAGRTSRTQALRLAHDLDLAHVGGSDAHMLGCVGLARTRFPGESIADLRAALEARTSNAEGRFARPDEIAAEALPQLARSMVHLPLRRAARLGPALRQRWSTRSPRPLPRQD